MKSKRPKTRARRRWRKWLLFALVLVVIRLMLPAVVAPLLATRLSAALGTRVDIADVSLQPLDAIITLRRVTVHAPAGTDAGVNPPIVAPRVRVDLQWLPLLHRKIELRELAFEAARIELDRFADGRFGLANLEGVDPDSELPSGWSFALHRISARDSRLRIRDLAAEGSALLNATLRSASLSGIRRRATAFGKVPNLHVDAIVGGGRLRVHARCELRDDGLVLDAQMRMKDVPLSQANAYVADLGWSDVAGRLSGELRWQREPRRRDLLTGRAVLRRARIQIGDLTEPALAIRSGIAADASIDLLTRRVTIGSLSLRGATLAVRADGGPPIPLLATAFSQAPAGHSQDRRSSGGDPRSRWNWMIERFDTTGGRVRIYAVGGAFDLQAQASGENFGPGAYWSPLRFDAHGGEVAAAFDGTARLRKGVIIEGRLTAAGIDIPGMARAAGLPWADLARSGRATADLSVQLDSANSDSYARGSIRLTDVQIAAPEPNVFAFASPTIDLKLERFEPRQAPDSDGGGGQPPRVVFSEARIDAPDLLLTRTAGGWMLPPFAPTAEDVTHTFASAPAAMDAAQTAFNSLRTSGGRLRVIDLLPTTDVRWDLTGVQGSVNRLFLPDLSFEDLQLEANINTSGQLYLGGRRDGGGFQFLATGDGVTAAALTPYLRNVDVPYGFAGGKVGFVADGMIAADRWNANAALTLHDSTIAGIEALEASLGMPASSALALLRDENGATTLQLALASPGKAFAEQVASGIRSTIRSVTELAAAERGRSHLPTVRLSFPPGQALLTAATVREIERVANLLAVRPGLVVELSAATLQEDRRWLAEQALLPVLSDSGGFLNVLRAFGMQDARARIRIAIAARSRGAPGELSADDEAMLARMIAEVAPLAEKQLTSLRDARLSQIVKHFDEHHGLTTSRVVVRRIAHDDGDAAAVTLQVAIAEKAAAAAQVLR